MFTKDRTNGISFIEEQRKLAMTLDEETRNAVLSALYAEEMELRKQQRYLSNNEYTSKQTPSAPSFTINNPKSHKYPDEKHPLGISSTSVNTTNSFNSAEDDPNYDNDEEDLYYVDASDVKTVDMIEKKLDKSDINQDSFYDNVYRNEVLANIKNYINIVVKTPFDRRPIYKLIELLNKVNVCTRLSSLITHCDVYEVILKCLIEEQFEDSPTMFVEIFYILEQFDIQIGTEDDTHPVWLTLVMVKALNNTKNFV